MIIGLWWIVGGGEEEEEGRWLRCILWHKLHDPQIITDRLARQLLHKKEILASIDDICLSAQKIYSVCVQKTQPVCMFRKYIICAWSDNNFLCVCSANLFCVHVQKIHSVCVFRNLILCVCVQQIYSVCVEKLIFRVQKMYFAVPPQFLWEMGASLKGADESGTISNFLRPHQLSFYIL